MAGNSDFGKDEDASEALLKRHEAFMSDLEAFDNTIRDLRNQASICRQQVLIYIYNLVKIFFLVLFQLSNLVCEFKDSHNLPNSCIVKFAYKKSSLDANIEVVTVFKNTNIYLQCF